MKTAPRHLLPLLFVLALAACGNKGPLVLPTAPPTTGTPAPLDAPADEDEYSDDDFADDDSGSGAARGA